MFAFECILHFLSQITIGLGYKRNREIAAAFREKIMVRIGRAVKFDWPKIS